MRILVTGGAGFIGSHIVEAYVAEGHEVLVVDNLWAHGGGRREHVPPGVPLIELDIRDRGLHQVVKEFAPEIINHHAAQHSVAIGSRDPIFDAEVNVLGLLNVLEAAVAAGVGKILFASSGATYGEPAHLPIDESTPQAPQSPYGITKMVAEQYLRFYRAEHGLDFTALRYGNVYGPRQDPYGEAGVIAIFLARFLAGEGVRIDGDGEQTRDYVYVEDVARANVAALRVGSGGCYVIATGKKTSVHDIHRALAEVTGFAAPVTYAPRRPGDVRNALFNPARAAAELDWHPQIALLEGMRLTAQSLRFQGSGPRMGK